MRPVWKGYISFGLVSIPVSLYTSEKRNDLRFHLLDSRDKARIHYARVNSKTGKEVPWNEVVKAYEFSKGNYVVVDEEDFKQAAPEAFKSVDIEEFVNLNEINYLYFETPYYVIPEGANQKAYILLREALQKSKKVGVAKVVIHSKQHLALIMAFNKAIILNLIRFKEELRDEEEFSLPKQSLKTYRVSERELTMAIQLINDMSAKWNPEKYHDEYRAALLKWINTKKAGKKVVSEESEDLVNKPDDVIDFMTLLKKSLKKKSIKPAFSSKKKRS